MGYQPPVIRKHDIIRINGYDFIAKKDFYSWEKKISLEYIGTTSESRLYETEVKYASKVSTKERMQMKERKFNNIVGLFVYLVLCLIIAGLFDETNGIISAILLGSFLISNNIVDNSKGD